MKWTVLGNIIVAILPRLIGLIESKATPKQNGDVKKDTVKEIVLATVEGVEGATGRDVFNDPEVSSAYDAMNDAIVTFQNLMADKHPATVAPTSVP